MKGESLRDILTQASEEVESWPSWMQKPAMRNMPEEQPMEKKQITANDLSRTENKKEVLYELIKELFLAKEHVRNARFKCPASDDDGRYMLLNLDRAVIASISAFEIILQDLGCCNGRILHTKIH